jgi:hypothetical protein
VLVRLAPLFPAVLVLLACHASSSDPQPEQPDESAPVVEPDDGKPVSPTSEVKLSPLERDVNVPVGTTLLYSFQSHASVGFGAAQQVADSTVVEYLRTDTNYEQTEEQRAGKPGSDAATGVFVFQAVAPGSTTVTVDEQFRGTTETSTTFTITVTPK